MELFGKTLGLEFVRVFWLGRKKEHCAELELNFIVLNFLQCIHICFQLIVD